MAHYLNPKNDLAFKRVFGEHKHLCMSLLNALLPLENPIVSIEYRAGELISDQVEALRNPIVDVRCVDSDGRQFIVEMQLYWTESFKQRMLFSASKVYVTQLSKGEDVKLLRPVYALAFVDSIFEKSEEMRDQYFHHYKIVNIKDTGKQIKGLEFLFVELPKFKPQNRAEKKLHDLWLRFLTEINEGTKEVPQELLDNEDTREAISYMETGAYTREQMEAYDNIKLNKMAAHSIITDAHAEGKAEGRAEGRAELIANALRSGLSAEAISAFSGLTPEEIRKMAK